MKSSILLLLVLFSADLFADQSCNSVQCDIAALDSSNLHQEFRGLSESGERYAKTVSKGIREDIDKHGMRAVATWSDRALDALVDRSADELVNVGKSDYANYKRREWKLNYSGGIYKNLNSRDIGDHPTELLSQWLEDFYDTVELAVGVDLCRSLHLSDIKSINATVKICLHACTFPMDAVTGPREDEYRRHFNQGEVYYGLTPVIVYWACTAGMAAGGAPLPFVCSAAEFSYAKFLGGRLSDAIFARNCNQ